MQHLNLMEILSVVVYSGLGLVVFALAFFIIVKGAPFPVIKEIEEDQNTALAILIAGVFIGVSMIISAAISG